MKNCASHFHFFSFSSRYHGLMPVVTGFIFCFVFFGFFSIFVVSAYNYQKIAPGDTVTLGEFVYDDDFVATTTPCTIGITNPLNVEIVPSTTPMTANADGWHYYAYTTAGNAPSGVWPSFMTCGSAVAGDLVKVDKSFIVDSSIKRGYTVTLSDFEGTTVNTAYKAKLQVLNYATIPTDADSLPTVVIKDSAGTVQVPNGEMTKDSNGTYSYSYTIGSGVGGAWETVVSVVINGETIKKHDYWNLSSSPADVSIIDITDKIIPTITANVRIDNKGTSASDFYYVYCIVSSEANLCGGNDDVASGSDTKYIDAGGFINPSLTLDGVPTAGTYWFKVRARALAETNWAASTKQFTAETPPASCGDGTCNGSETCSSCAADCGQCGGGGGGGGGAAVIIPTITCNGADFNHDNKVNSVDFSILLAFWQKLPPYKNPCVDINKDNKVNSVDFSILLYQWKK